MRKRWAYSTTVSLHVDGHKLMIWCFVMVTCSDLWDGHEASTSMFTVYGCVGIPRSP